MYGLGLGGWAKKRGQAVEEDRVKVTGLVNVWFGTWELGKEEGSGSRRRPGKGHGTGKCMGRKWEILEKKHLTTRKQKLACLTCDPS